MSVWSGTESGLRRRGGKPGIRPLLAAVCLEGNRLVPGFRAHITASSIIGAGYGAAAWYLGGMPPTTAALGAGVVGVQALVERGAAAARGGVADQGHERKCFWIEGKDTT